MHAPEVSVARLSDNSAPLLLFLRAFRADTELYQRERRFSMVPQQIYFWSVEDYVNDILGHTYCSVAVGSPGELLQTPGAARLYVSDDCWQRVVSELIELADLIVFRTDRTPGVKWELLQLAESAVLAKTILVAITRQGEPECQNCLSDESQVLGCNLTTCDIITSSGKEQITYASKAHLYFFDESCRPVGILGEGAEKSSAIGDAMGIVRRLHPKIKSQIAKMGLKKSQTVLEFAITHHKKICACSFLSRL